MTEDAIRAIAQADPVPNLTKRWGELTTEARKIVNQLEDKLRELDQVTADLADHQLVVATDLGATGNAARAARTAMLADARTERFTLPGRAA